MKIDWAEHLIFLLLAFVLWYVTWLALDLVSLYWR